MNRTPNFVYLTFSFPFTPSLLFLKKCDFGMHILWGGMLRCQFRFVLLLYYVVANRTLVHLFMLNAIVLLFCGSWCSNQHHRVFISFVIAKRKLDLFGQCNHSSISAEMCKRQICVLVQMCKHQFISRLFQLSTLEPVAKI